MLRLLLMLMALLMLSDTDAMMLCCYDAADDDAADADAKASDAEHALLPVPMSLLLLIYFNLPVNGNVVGRMSALSTSHTSK